MLRTIKIFLAMAALISALVSLEPLLAQSITYKPLRPFRHSALTLIYYSMNFSYVGSETPVVALDFSCPAIALGYSFQERDWNGKLQIGYGRQDADKNTIKMPSLRLLDIELIGSYGNVFLLKSRRSTLSLFFPFLFSYRRLDISSQNNINKSGLLMLRGGIGLVGFGLNSRLGSRVTLESRVALIRTKFFENIEIRNVNVKSDLKNVYEANVQMHWEQLFGARHGLTFGLGFRVQHCPVLAIHLFPGNDALLSTFKGAELGMCLGIH